MMADIKQKYAQRAAGDPHAPTGMIPYKVVVKTMDTLRGKPTAKCTGKDGCLFDQVILSAGVQ